MNQAGLESWIFVSVTLLTVAIIFLVDFKLNFLSKYDPLPLLAVLVAILQTLFYSSLTQNKLESLPQISNLKNILAYSIRAFRDQEREKKCYITLALLSSLVLKLNKLEVLASGKNYFKKSRNLTK